MILVKSTLSLRMVLGEVKTTTEMEFGGSYRDKTQNDLIVPSVVLGKSTGTVEVILFPAPADNVSRLIDDFYLNNTDSVTHTGFIYFLDGANKYHIRTFSLIAGAQLQYGNYRGFLP